MKETVYNNEINKALVAENMVPLASFQKDLKYSTETLRGGFMDLPEKSHPAYLGSLKWTT